MKFFLFNASEKSWGAECNRGEEQEVFERLFHARPRSHLNISNARAEKGLDLIEPAADIEGGDLLEEIVFLGLLSLII